jgi:sigma-B regulation protein RsbU (phosphoserine phosphatase)
VLIGGVAPLAVGYALVARKPYSMRLLTRRALRHSLMTLTVLVVFLLLLGGLNWLTTGSLLSLSAPAILAAVLLAALITMPLRGRLRNFFDRTFDRSQYDFREGVVEFARGLPHIFDHPTLVARLEETLKRAMRARRFYFFVLDRQTRTLGPQSGGGERPAQVEGVKFDPLEPLCRYLMEKRRPFEVEVSPYSPELVPVFRSAADRLGKLGAAVVVGLRRRHELLGLMILGSKTSDEFYDAEELDLLMILAREAALAVENIDLFEEVARDRELRKELEDASELQAQLLPGAPPHLVRGRILGRCIPCRSVGGDFFDFLELPGEKVGLVIADVSGKGMTASLMAANVHRLLHSHSPAAETLTELTARMNRQLYESSRGARYCAMFCGVYDDASRRLEYVNAGHCPPLLLAPWGERFLEATGLPLGLFPEVNHRPRSELLDSGTVVVFYSDGITDAPNGRGESYGLDRLVGVVSHHRELDPPRLLAKILEDIQDFSAGAPIEDDQTLVLLRIV